MKKRATLRVARFVVLHYPLISNDTGYRKIGESRAGVTSSLVCFLSIVRLVPYRQHISSRLIYTQSI